MFGVRLALKCYRCPNTANTHKGITYVKAGKRDEPICLWCYYNDQLDGGITEEVINSIAYNPDLKNHESQFVNAIFWAWLCADTFNRKLIFQTMLDLLKKYPEILAFAKPVSMFGDDDEAQEF